MNITIFTLIITALFVQCFRGAKGPGRAVAMSTNTVLAASHYWPGAGTGSITSGRGCNTCSRSRTLSMLHISQLSLRDDQAVPGRVVLPLSLLCCGHLTETLGLSVWLDVASQTASVQQSHVKTCNNHPSHILDVIRLQGLSIETFVHWRSGAEHASSAAAGSSAIPLAAYLFVQLELARQGFLISCLGVCRLVKCAARGDTRVR